MSDLPENLQVIKTEPTTPSSSPDKCTNHIKERLNLHVKRRLQQDNNAATLEPVTTNHDSLLNTNNAGIAVAVGEQPKRRGHNSKETTSPKTRRPYQKRADKTKLDGSGTAASFTGSSGGGSAKNKKTSSTTTLMGGNGSNVALIASPNNNALDALDDSFEQEVFGGSGVIAGQEIESSKTCSTSRDKDKFPDVLSMVLSVKKRALMQDPEVQEMLSKIMEVVKS